LDLNAVVKGITNMVRRVIGDRVELMVDLDTALGQIKADEGQIQQILLNLAVNARDAMPDGGRFSIQTRNVLVDSCAAPNDLSGNPGALVVLSISDTGCGMDEETQSHIFEPFFTTKELGNGTGLGLSIVYGIVKHSGGHISVESVPGSGTTFRIHLPRINEEAASEKATPLSAGKTAQGPATILVVEADSGVRYLIQEILTLAGYHVIATEDGERALAVSDEYTGEIQLLLTDVLPTKVPGGESVRSLAKRRALKVLYTSGVAANKQGSNGALDSGVDFLQKPFTPESLGAKVGYILNAIPGGTTRPEHFLV
jgi:CheY-like chemotaxis protein